MTDLLGSPEKSDASFRKFREEGQKGLLLGGPATGDFKIVRVDESSAIFCGIFVFLLAKVLLWKLRIPLPARSLDDYLWDLIFSVLPPGISNNLN